MDFTGKARCICGKEMSGNGGSFGVLSASWRNCECGINAVFYSVHDDYELIVRAQRKNEQQLIQEERQSLLNCFKDANIEVLQSWNIENGYSGGQADWLLVNTSLGMITIGWRKRVISIDWYNTGIKHLVKSDSTKWEEGCHAWGYQKASEALSSLKGKFDAQSDHHFRCLNTTI